MKDGTSGSARRDCRKTSSAPQPEPRCLALPRSGFPDVVVDERPRTPRKASMPGRADASGGAPIDVEIETVADGIYRVSPDACLGTRVPAVIISSPNLLRDLRRDPGLEQLLNLAQLPGVVSRVLAMPTVTRRTGCRLAGS